MRAVISRKYTSAQTEGVFQLIDDNGVVIFACHSLELPNKNNEKQVSCIPEGVYSVHKHISPSKGECFSIPNVPFRDNILIHKANFVGSKNPKTGHSDLLGCIALGSGYADLNGDGIKDLINSGVTMSKLLKLAPEQFNLTITKDERP